jgi:hypothetical protein
LNNATEGNAKWYLAGWGDPKPEPDRRWWTADDVFVDLEYPEMIKAYDAVCALSGLTVKVEKGQAKPGEELAADTPVAS